MEKKSRIIYIVSFINFSYGLEWMADNMNKSKYAVDFIFLDKTVPEIFQSLKQKGIKVVFIRYRGKRDLLNVMMRLFVYFLRNKPEIIHAHLFDASFAALPVAWLAGVKKRIYTRHHATIHHNSHPKAIKYDRLINYFSTKIIAVSENVKKILIEREFVEEAKIFVVHHGFDFKITETRKELLDAIREKYKLDGFYPIVGLVSRFVDWKGVQFVIPAFKMLLTEYPNAKLVLANANGNYKKEIVELLASLPFRNYVTIEFEKDVFSLMKCFDMIVHVPIDLEAEAFGQIYVEAMSCRVPVICTLSGVAGEYIVDEKNALVVPYCNSESIYFCMKKLLEIPDLRSAIIDSAYIDVIEGFSIKKMIIELLKVYG